MDLASQHRAGRWAMGFAWRITGAYLGLILVVLLGIALYIGSFTRSTYVGELEAQLGAEARITAGEAAVGLAAASEPTSSADAMQALATRIGADSGARITLIAPDGLVLGDSAESPANMENHSNRPEVIDALQTGQGVSLRRSATVGYDMLYVAVPIQADGQVLGVARASLPLEAVDRSAAALVGAVALAIGLAALAAAAIALWIGRTTTRPIKRLTVLAGRMAAGQLDHRLRATSDDEVGELGKAFNQMADRLQATIATISAERNRLAAILDVAADGLVIVEADGRVV